MKRSDLLLTLIFLLIFAPFIIWGEAFDWYLQVNHELPYMMSFVKFFVLATLGEVLGLRLRKGSYQLKGFGLLPRAIVWGFLGITIKLAFEIFAAGSPAMLASMGVQFPTDHPADILNQDFFSHFSWIQLLAALSVGTMLNLFFAPVFMTVHKISDTHIEQTGGTLRGFFSPMPVREIMASINWRVQWSFVFKRTIPLFWIPAQTFNFLLPAEHRVLVAAIYSVILGVILAIAAQKGKAGK
ncbi:MAG: Mpv17/PMP22 family protein [Bacteroidales bacterium]|nr:Mpv17/PMP22 family protein [Bacteroidales bacterium]